MLRFMMLLVFILAGTDAQAQQDRFKQGVINGYRNRCIEVMRSKGYAERRIRQVCSCEVEVIGKDFSVFEWMLRAAKKAAGGELMSKSEVQEFKAKLRKCRN